MTRDVRTPSYVEQKYVWRTKLGCYSNFRVLGEYSEELSVEKVYSAITKMMYRFSVFATEVVPDAKAPAGHVFSFAETITLNDVVQFIDDEALNKPETVLDRYHYEKFKFARGNALWRVKIINKKYALFFCDHILFDGTSGKNFHIEFSKCLTESHDNPAGSFCGLDSVVFAKEQVKADEFQLLPAPCDVVNYNGPFLFNLYHYLVESAPKCISDWVRYHFGGNPYSHLLKYDHITYKSVLVPDETNRCTILNLDKTKISALIKISRSHNVKLTALLIMLGHLSVGRLFADSEKDTTTGVCVNTRAMIDQEKAKRLCANYSSAFGVYMSEFGIDLPAIKKLCPDGKVNWDLVSFINTYIHDNVSTAPYLLGLLKYWADPKDYVVETYTTLDKYTLEISNLGMVPPALTNIVNMWFDQPSETFSINSISTAAGGANLALRCCSNAYVDGFKEYMEAAIQDLLTSEGF